MDKEEQNREIISQLKIRNYLKAIASNFTFNENYSEILPYLYLGGDEAASNPELLKKLGINYILNCASCDVPLNSSFYQENGLNMNFLSFPADDNMCYDMTQHISEACQFIDDCRKSNGKILIHCVMGINRSGFITAAYIMTQRNWGVIETVEFIRSKRSLVLTNERFLTQLIKYAYVNGLFSYSNNQVTSN
ncbi:unnamed protein product [Dimorphilus gyrociliatus]|uniref:protein-tyrosine-phosphatase n=1 Tax=Dimorphilus gyrociliatus TaxID=2664684 RepID=A0A7I8W8H3_9ANNE|nr:unnamed protein product [Dimorphilus gyrociliatus]